MWPAQPDLTSHASSAGGDARTYLPPAAFFLADGYSESDPDPGAALISRLAAGAPTEADVRAVCRAAQSWLHNEGRIPLERSLRLPTSFEAHRRMRRDGWLCRAAALLEPQESRRAACARLEQAWLQFRRGATWRAWTDLATPPSNAAEFEVALFHATRANRSQCLSAKQLERLVGHVFRSKCPTVVDTFSTEVDAIAETVQRAA